MGGRPYKIALVTSSLTTSSVVNARSSICHPARRCNACVRRAPTAAGPSGTSQDVTCSRSRPRARAMSSATSSSGITALIRRWSRPRRYVHCPHRSPTHSASRTSTYADTTDSAASCTSTDTPPDLHGRHYRHPQRRRTRGTSIRSGRYPLTGSISRSAASITNHGMNGVVPAVTAPILGRRIRPSIRSLCGEGLTHPRAERHSPLLANAWPHTWTGLHPAAMSLRRLSVLQRSQC